jgi:hypothetical protein
MNNFRKRLPFFCGCSAETALVGGGKESEQLHSLHAIRL